MVRRMGRSIAGIIQHRTTRHVRVKQAKRTAMLHRCALSLLLVLPCATANADHQMTLADLYGFCTSKDASDHNSCTFYILGIFEGVQLASDVLKDKTHFCVPEQLSSSAMEFVVRKDMGADLAVYPDDGQMPAVSFVTGVIAKEFSCARAK
jgi:hypothetical protein